LVLDMKRMKIPFSDLARQESTIQNAIEPAVVEALRSGEYIYSPIVESFEEELAAYCDVRYAISVASGTDALILGLIGAGIRPGDEVITPAFTFFSTAGAIVHAGATPIFVDVEGDNFNIDVAQVHSGITHKTRALITVHLYGQMAGMTRVSEVARSHDLLVIEDAAQAIGATYRGAKAGSFGLIGCLSFNYSKNLGTYGNGGAVLTNDTGLARELRTLRNYGLEGYFHHTRIGFNSRLSALQAAALRVKLKVIDEWNCTRNEIAVYYNQLLKDIDGVVIPTVGDERAHVYHKYTILAENREELKLFLAHRGIEAKVFYPEPLHQQPCFSQFHSAQVHLPVSERLAKQVLSLPLYPGLTDTEVDYVASCIHEFYASR
jgi:dTDP-4-amino-4,6-dideoxygalactose transaminase